MAAGRIDRIAAYEPAMLDQHDRARSSLTPEGRDEVFVLDVAPDRGGEGPR